MNLDKGIFLAEWSWVVLSTSLNTPVTGCKARMHAYLCGLCAMITTIYDIAQPAPQSWMERVSAPPPMRRERVGNWEMKQDKQAGREGRPMVWL